jgi:hypothetical protein
MYKKSEKLRLIRNGLESGKLLGQSIRDAGMKSYTTIDRWRERPMIDRYFTACINKMDSRRNDAVVDSLFKQAVNGNPTCIAIYLKFKMGWKDNPTFVNENHNVNIGITAAEKDEERKLLSRFDKLLKE